MKYIKRPGIAESSPSRCFPCSFHHVSLGKEVPQEGSHGVGGSAWAEPTPYGMVLIDRGSIAMGPSSDDSISGIKADPKGISVDAFWMDETEITNSKYKQFVFWVRDSIIRERACRPCFRR